MLNMKQLLQLYVVIPPPKKNLQFILQIKNTCLEIDLMGLLYFWTKVIHENMLSSWKLFTIFVPAEKEASVGQ